MKTLLKDTLETLKFNGLSENDVEWAGMDKIWFSWEEFKLLADVDYDEETQEVVEDLIIVGKNWWLVRGGCMNIEWWEVHKPPQKDDRKHEKPKKLTMEGY